MTPFRVPVEDVRLPRNVVAGCNFRPPRRPMCPNSRGTRPYPRHPRQRRGPAVSTTIVVSATVVTEDKRQAETAASVLSRAVSDLGADGIAASLSVGFPDDEDDEDTP